MRKILCTILFTAFVAVLGLPVSAQRNGPLGDIFQGQPPPPGAVTVLGRSFFGALANGFDGSLALIIGADDRNVRQELGLTDTEVNSIRLLRAQMLLNAPQYANRFRSMTEETRESVQADLSRDMGRITEYLNNALPEERKENVKRLVFQATGGLDSPIVSLHSMEVLGLSETQKGQMKSVFDDMREERVAHMEKMLGIAEKVVAAGGQPQSMSQEDQEQLRAEGDALRDQGLAMAKKLTERLRQHLTPEQLEKERQLMASRPAFLPPLPREFRKENQEKVDGDDAGPGPGAWRPGQELPGQILEQRSSRFPRGE